MNPIAVAIAGAIVVVVVVVGALIYVIGMVEHRRRKAEKELVWAEMRVALLEEQVPFPYGETMPK